ncbi:oxygen-independent coproporphyrinogen-3 oxidase [Rhodococcus erythropolis]|uniref:radical SAM family heme chaperone HemW n=1 Tax=Rhodococcus erythropolis TaxID=1833 RepID=UPI000876E98C|nr:radical SAM family heme chaperone HemW [Rhodococcus erythropolis]SCY07953.1 oxygen-independent coproporphyrinogen-3 oxidase [Rhodococcus erythropolis]
MNATSTTPTRQSEATPFALPARSLEGVGKRPFGIYIHVPFCATRCGYCDFNTYTAGELGTSASPQSWLEGLRRELDLAAEMTGAPAAETVFVGGGTPSLLGGDGLSDVLSAVRSSFGLASGAEVTTESNPESTSPEFFDALRSAGFTRISLGMQSAAQHVLKILDRTHTPGRAVAAAKEARAAGFSHVNLDLIYGTPGERDQDLDASLDAVLSADVDHVSAYALIVEDGTAMARKVRRGELPAPDDDVLASRYERIDSRLSEAGLHWYEVSNWAKAETADSGDTRCRHNLGYWDGGDWWGAGPGAHSHVGGVRWWNVKHPARYAEQLALGVLPVGGSEELTAEDEHMERVMLTARLRTGLPLSELSASERLSADQVVVDRLAVIENDHVVLTDRGRLLADAVIRTILT